MPVYHDHELIHVHIPKTAGTAIQDYFGRLGDVRGGRESWIGKQWWGGRWYELQHLSFRELRALAGSRYERFESFAVVRDPYDRLVSDFHWRAAIRDGQPHARISAFDSFEAFLAAIPEDLDARWDELVRGAEEAEANLLIHLRPQHQYLCDLEGAPCIDDVIRMEDLANGMARLLLRHGRQTGTFRPRPRRPLEEYYDRSALDFVNEVYARDFELLCYERA